MRKLFPETRTHWPDLSTYERFEQVTAIFLSIAVSLVIIFALWRLVLEIFVSVPGALFETTRFDIVGAIFAKVFVVLIALEFNHTLRGLIQRRRSIVQAQSVVLIALLAVLRKLIVMKITPEETNLLLALSALVVALGGVYWALRRQGGRSERTESAQ